MLFNENSQPRGMRKKCLSLAIIFMLALPTLAQKKPLTVGDCEKWRELTNCDLSPTGRYVVYSAYSPYGAETDGESRTLLHIFDVKTRKSIKLKDADFVKFLHGDKEIYYQKEEGGAEKTIFYNLQTGARRTWDHAEPFSPIPNTDYSIAKTSSRGSTTQLVIRNYNTLDSLVIKGVTSYLLYANNDSIIFNVRDGRANVLHHGALRGPYQKIGTFESKGTPSISFDEAAHRGVIQSRDSVWYAFSVPFGRLEKICELHMADLPKGMSLYEAMLLKNRKYLLLKMTPRNMGGAHARPRRKKADDFVECWVWNDERTPGSRQSFQQRTKMQTYLYDISKARTIHLGPSTNTYYVPENLSRIDYVMVQTDSAYRADREKYEKLPDDIYLLDVNTQKSRKVFVDVRAYPRQSPDKRLLLVYAHQQKAWMCVDMKDGSVRDVSSAIGHPVYDVSYDKPAPPPPYGFIGWTEKGRGALISDGYDWWNLDLLGGANTYCFTKGRGRRGNKSFYKFYTNIDKDTFGLDDFIMVKEVDHATMDEAMVLLGMDGSYRKIRGGAYDYRILAFSENQKAYIWSRQNFNTYRDLWWSAMDKQKGLRLTDVNPQQKEYRWGTVRIVEWENYAGKRNRGLLYMPEGYDAKKKYPMIVQFYETHSHDLNTYISPALSNAMANVTYLVSNGYLVFMPDVSFEVGRPGQSSYDAVVSGVRCLLDKQIAHPGMVGLQGHSWSGFQTAYLVTKTNVFTCANIEAPISDMATGYLGVRSESGQPRFFMYEETQSRMGKTLWEDKQGYRNHSPIMEADKIEAPLLIWHNDADGAVPFEQGRALYLAMRRLHKPAWFVNYKGEGHFLNSTKAQKDWTIKMMQFFDFYLKKKEEPAWMRHTNN